VSGSLSKASIREIGPEEDPESWLATLANMGAICRVRSLRVRGGTAFEDAVPVWWTADADVALLALSAPPSGRDGVVVPSITWADVAQSQPVEVTAVGFPEADVEQGLRESRQISGHLNPLSGLKAGRYVISVGETIGRVPTGATSSWAGMSGAAVFAEDVLVGLLLVDADPTHPERLELWALPARTFADHPSFLRWIHWGGGDGTWIRSLEPPSSAMTLLRRIAESNKQLPVLGSEVVAKITAALDSRSLQTEDTETRRAVSTVLSLLRSRNVLYADLDNEIWQYVFASLRELRQALTETHATVVVNGPAQVTALVEVMLTAAREYLGRHETAYVRYMAENIEGQPVPRWEREWPGLYQAALELMALREVLVGAIAPLNAFARKEEQLDWGRETHTQNYVLSHTSPDDPTPSSRGSQPHGAELHEQSSLQALVAALHSDILSTRVAAVDELARRIDPDVVAILIETLEDEELVPVSYAETNIVATRCWDALRRSEIGRQHLPVLMRLTSENAAQLDLLVPFADDPEVMRLFVRKIEDGLRTNRLPFLDGLFAKFGKAVVPELSQLLFSTDESTRRKAADLLCKTDELSTLPAVLDYLGRADEQERSDLSHALWEFSDQRSVLAGALKHRSASARAAAVRVAAYSDPMSVVDLLDRAAADPDPEVRVALMERIEEWRGRYIDSPEVVSLLESGLRDADPRVRAAAASGSYAAFQKGSAPRLLPLLKDRDSSVRAKVAQLVGYCADPAATASLVALARDCDSGVRMAVMEALADLATNVPVERDVFVRALDDRLWVVRSRAIRGLAALSDRGAVPKLCTKLNDKNEWVRQDAVAALSKIGDAAAIPCLSNALWKADTLMRRQIIQALAAFGSTEAFAVLLEVARRDPSEYGLVQSLTYTRNRRAIPVLELIQEHAGPRQQEVERTLRSLRSNSKSQE
jgi:HEAT repeat protein